MKTKTEDLSPIGEELHKLNIYLVKVAFLALGIGSGLVYGGQWFNDHYRIVKIEKPPTYLVNNI